MKQAVEVIIIINSLNDKSVELIFGISKFICVVTTSHQCWFLKKIFGGKQLTVLPPWLHPVCDVAKAGLL